MLDACAFFTCYRHLSYWIDGSYEGFLPSLTFTAKREVKEWRFACVCSGNARNSGRPSKVCVSQNTTLSGIHSWIADQEKMGLNWALFQVSSKKRWNSSEFSPRTDLKQIANCSLAAVGQSYMCIEQHWLFSANTILLSSTQLYLSVLHKLVTKTVSCTLKGADKITIYTKK